MKTRLLTIAFLLAGIYAQAQCAMCKANVESNMQNGGNAAEGLNEGIIYLMFIPYLILGALGYAFYKHRQGQKTL